MLKRILSGIGVAFCAVGLLHAQAAGPAGQGGGRGGGRAANPEFPTAQAFADSKEAQAHVAAAMKIGGSDMADTAKWFCTATGPQRVALARAAAGLPKIPTEPVGPIKLFDNLTYFGFNDVGGWVIPTSAGLIVFDTLNSTADAMNVIVPELQKAGFDPAQIKYVILGHGHADHFGGASYLQKTYHPKILAAMPDWAAIEKGGRGDAVPGVTPDMDITNGQKLTLGDTTVTLVRLPGHTPGTVGMIMPAKFKGQTHMVMIMSGTQMPTQDSLDSFKGVFAMAKAQHVESYLGSHPDILMNPLTTMEAIRDQYPTGNNPLLLTQAKAARYADIMLECARARLSAQGRLTSTN